MMGMGQRIVIEKRVFDVKEEDEDGDDTECPNIRQIREEKICLRKK